MSGALSYPFSPSFLLSIPDTPQHLIEVYSSVCQCWRRGNYTLGDGVQLEESLPQQFALAEVPLARWRFLYFTATSQDSWLDLHSESHVMTVRESEGERVGGRKGRGICLFLLSEHPLIQV